METEADFFNSPAVPGIARYRRYRPEPRKVEPPVAVDEEDVLAVVSPLGHMVRDIRNDDSRESRHMGSLAHPKGLVNNGGCPRYGP